MIQRLYYDCSKNKMQYCIDLLRMDDLERDYEECTKCTYNFAADPY